MRNIFVYSLFMLGMLSACKSTSDKIKNDMMPVARGEADEIILVIDSTMYEGEVGDVLKSMYRDYMIGLPQDEYKFSLNKVNPLKLNKVLRNAKNLVFVMTLEGRTLQNKAIREYFTDQSLNMIKRDSSLFYTAKKDVFARGQIVLYLFAQTEDQLVEKLKYNKSSLVELFESAVRERVREKIFARTEKQKMKAITEDHGYQIKIPFGWDIAKNLQDFVWLRQLEAESEMNVFIHERPYTDKAVFNNIDELREEITSTYLRDSEKPELYITRQEIIPSFTERVTFSGNFAVEARGLWRVSDNTAGGPFVSYTFVDEATQKLYYIEGYVYSPGTTKKELVRKVEAILSTFKTPSQMQSPS